MTLKSKNAIVTGSTSGIGLAYARALAAEGANVMINGFGKPEDIEAERVKIERDFGVKALYSAADMTKPDQIAGMVKQGADAFGSVDILINNAGVQHVEPIETFPVDKWDQIIAINMSAAFHAMRAAIPGMKAKGWGRFVAVGSATAKEPVGNIHHVLANTTRPAAVGFIKTLSDEVARYGITCNTVAPGWIGTDNMYNYLEKKMGISHNAVPDFLFEGIPARRVGRPEEIASTIAYLCSHLAGYISGNWIVVDGGKHASAF